MFRSLAELSALFQPPGQQFNDNISTQAMDQAKQDHIARQYMSQNMPVVQPPNLDKNAYQPSDVGNYYNLAPLGFGQRWY